MQKQDIFLFIISIVVIIWIFINTTKSFKALTSGKEQYHIINPRAFIWKTMIFTAAAVMMIFSEAKTTLSLTITALLLALAAWNAIYAVRFYRWKKNRTNK